MDDTHTSTAASWDPHHRREVVAAAGSQVKGFDLRSMKYRPGPGPVLDTNARSHKQSMCYCCCCCCWCAPSHRETLTIEAAHAPTVRSVDHNPNKPRFIVTAGDDCRVKFWDLRRTQTPVKTLVGHTHWCARPHHYAHIATSLMRFFPPPPPPTGCGRSSTIDSTTS